MLIELINQKMKNEGLSIRSAAREIGVSHSTVRRVLEGFEIDLPTLSAICNWLGVSPASALNSLIDGPDAFAAKLALLIEINPKLKEVFEEAIDNVLKGPIPLEVLNDVAAYAAFRISQYM